MDRAVKTNEAFVLSMSDRKQKFWSFICVRKTTEGGV